MDSDRNIRFQGEYICIFNEVTDDIYTLKQCVTKETAFDVPKGYTVLIIGSESVRFLA